MVRFVQHRHERVRVETDRHRITGTLLLPPEGYRSRVTDYLNAHSTEFIALTDAEVQRTGEQAEHRDFVAISVRHIVLAEELGPAEVERYLERP